MMPPKVKYTIAISIVVLEIMAGVAIFCQPHLQHLLPAEGPLLAGTSKCDITPIEPLPLWGYSSYHDTLSQGTLDSLSANVLVLACGKEKIAIVSLDLGRCPSAEVMSDVRKQIAKKNIRYAFIAATHTHHGPVLELANKRGRGKGRFDSSLRYYTQLTKKIVQAISDADQSLRPAKMATGTVKLHNFNTNRQSTLPPIPADDDLMEMRLDDASGKPMALVVNFAAHPTLVPRSVLKYSADYPGVVKREVEQQTGANVLFMQGAAGDLAPASENCEEFGHQMAQQIVKLYATMRPQLMEKAALQVTEETLSVNSRVDFGNREVLRQLDEAFFPELVANYADSYAGGIRPHLTVALLNHEIGLVGVSGEFFCNHAIRLKERARVKQLFFFGYCNGYQQYFPTIEAIAEGGYGTEPLSAPSAAGSGEEIMNRALIRLYDMLDGKDSVLDH